MKIRRQRSKAAVILDKLDRLLFPVPRKKKTRTVIVTKSRRKK